MSALGRLLILDTGPYSYVAQEMAKYYDKVFYHRISGGPYQESPQAHIGEGLPGVTRVNDKEVAKIIDKMDAIWFPDVGQLHIQKLCRLAGLPVCSSYFGGEMENEKDFFYEQLAAAGLPVAKTYRAEGLTDLWDHVKDKPGPLYMKNADRERGDWETKPHLNRYQTKKIIDEARAALGQRAEEIEILVQSKIEAECEVGVDTFMLDGRIPQKVCIGYEDKDEAIGEAVLDKCPRILADIVKALEPVYRKLGIASPWANEVRITANGKAYPIDDTCRCASPPTASLLKLLGESYAKAIYSLAHNEMPVIEEDFRYAAELILSSKWYDKHELHLGAASELEKVGLFVKNGRGEDGQIYAIPNGDEGIFGSLVSVSKTSFEDAAAEVVEHAKDLQIYQLDCDTRAFERIGEKIKNGRKFGINF